MPPPELSRARNLAKMSDGDVKKISDDLGKEIVQKHDLKHAETVEKNVLPTAAGSRPVKRLTWLF